MRAYIIRRMLLVVPTLLAVTLAVFMTVRFIPGSVIDLMVAEMMNGGSGTGDTAAMEAQLRQYLGLDQPLHLQYLRWLGVARQQDGRFSGVIQGDLGYSMW